MITLLFWNLNKKPLQSSIKNIADMYQVDILMFAECDIPPDEILKTLNKESSSYYYAPGICCEKIKIYSRFSADFIRPKEETSRLTIRHLNLPGLRDILLVILHLPSQMHWSKESISDECIYVSDMIIRSEQAVGHSRTILVGDFNINPFEKGVVSAIGFNAVMTRAIADKKSRIVQGEEYPFFYNPMWSFYGDKTFGPSGTYYYAGSQHIEYFWNIFDQVLIRPELLSCIDKNFVKILDSDGNISFLNQQGVPDSNKVSDHLPILFNINL